MGLGQIPVLAILEYGRTVAKARGEMLDMFKYIIRQLDHEYLKIRGTQDEEDRKNAKDEHERKVREEEEQRATVDRKRRRR